MGVALFAQIFVTDESSIFGESLGEGPILFFVGATFRSAVYTRRPYGLIVHRDDLSGFSRSCCG